MGGHQRLIEPFAGGGSIFLNAGLKTALINDNCSDLIKYLSAAPGECPRHYCEGVSIIPRL
ncbi:hypothetical protein HGT70_14635 [Rosenbergiella collisarenosi]|uniref:DNA adenine methylase n=1 Tax=Rosenbergiella collisarenosi TaxID=1544695 RepID=UPI001BD9FAC5|nr:hypothetical protein [Rosenbergiella collisarenosi]